jgi:hypothetical protein
MHAELYDRPAPDGVKRFGHLSGEQMAELIRWFESLAMAEDPSDVLKPPAFYRATAAWLQMYGLDMVDERSDIMPWNMPEPLADYYSDVWYAQRVAIVAAHKRNKLEVLREAAGQTSVKHE